jgi:hypothetical protein
MIAVAVVAVMFVLALLGGGLIRVVWLRHGDLRAAERRLQAEWLAESALDRAAARLNDDANYAGETWTIPAERLGSRDGGSVRIVVDPVPDHPDRRVVRARADFPADGPRRVRHSRSLTITVRPSAAPERKGDSPR